MGQSAGKAKEAGEERLHHALLVCSGHTFALYCNYTRHYKNTMHKAQVPFAGVICSRRALPSQERPQ